MKHKLDGLTPEEFEELTKDLLVLDGFTNVQVHAKGSDDGIDITAVKNVPIAHGRDHRIAWAGQCKHVTSGRALGRDVVDKILYNFDSQSTYQGLMIVTSTKLSSPAARRISQYMLERNRLVFCWDITDIEAFLLRHPFLLDKFPIGHTEPLLPGASAIRTLLLSDGSVFAYHVYNVLRRFGFQLRETRLHQYGSSVLPVVPSEIRRQFDLVLVFLGELYWCPISRDMIDGLRTSVHDGVRALFTPFCAWSVGAGVNPSLDSLLPVRVKQASIDILGLIVPDPPATLRGAALGLPSYEDTFIENRMVEMRVDKGGPFSSATEFTGRSTYEFLELKRDAKCLASDQNDNPILVIQSVGRGRTAYLNLCAHNCMTPFPLKSPLEDQHDLARMIAEFALHFARADEMS